MHYQPAAAGDKPWKASTTLRNWLWLASALMQRG